MDSPFSSIFFTFFALFSMCMFSTNALRYEVGDEDGWIVPEGNDSNYFNQWASRNRFHIGDTIHFKFDDDSVMVVSRLDYEHCISTYPLFYSNNGDTEVSLQRPGLYYFISGISGHCKKGQKMIVRVMNPPIIPESSFPAQLSDAPAPSPDANRINASTANAAMSSITVLLIISLLGFLFF